MGETEIKILITYILQGNIRKYVRIVLPIKVLTSYSIIASCCSLGDEKIINLDVALFLIAILNNLLD